MENKKNQINKENLSEFKLIKYNPD